MILRNSYSGEEHFIGSTRCNRMRKIQYRTDSEHYVCLCERFANHLNLETVGARTDVILD